MTAPTAIRPQGQKMATQSVQEVAREVFATFDENEREGVRSAMFPFAKTNTALAKSVDGRDLAVELMTLAKAK